MKKKVSLFLAACLCLGLCGCKEEMDEKEITVYMPDGAPALALAGAMALDTEDDGVTYRVVESSLIKTKVTYTDMDENADLCVLPLTAATKLVGSGEKYQMLGAVTHGNLYLISKNTEFTFTVDNLSTLVGKTVGVLQLGEVPGLVFKTILHNNGLAYNELSGGATPSADKVNLQAIAGPQDVGALEGVDVFVLAEPAVSAQKAKGFAIVGDLQTLYGGEKGYPQAVLVAKNTLIAEEEAWVRSFVEDVKTSVEWLKTVDGAKIVSAVTAHLESDDYQTSLKANLLNAEGVISRCGVRFEQAKDCGARATAFLTAAKAVSEKQASVPAEAFYCALDFNK